MDPLRHFCDVGGVLGPTLRSVSQGGNPAGLEVGADWVEVALARRQTMGRPDQICAVESRGGTGGRGVGDRGWGKVGRGKVKEGQREVG